MVRLPKSLHRRLACGGGCTVRADGQGRSRLGGMSHTLGPGAVDLGDLRYGQYIVKQYPEYRSVLLSGQKRLIAVKNALAAACAR